MIYLGSFGIVALITFFGFYYVYKTKGKEMKKDKKSIVGLSIILDTIIKKFDRRKPFEGTHRTVVCST